MKFLAAKEFFMNLEIIYLLIAGACGALAKDLIEDGAIQIPFRSDGKFYLGFFSVESINKILATNQMYFSSYWKP